MRAMQIQDAYGIDNLKLVERDVPKPGHGQIVIRLKASSLNYRDLATVKHGGGMGFTLPLPLIPNSDGAGEVVELGEGVTRVKKGDRVCPAFFQGWIGGGPAREKMSAPLGGPLDGCAQEYICVNAEYVSKIPDYMSYEEAATLPCAGLTAWRALIVENNLRAGETVLLQGTGGVSIFALQFAKAMGARVIITSSSDEKLERARKLGADETINYRSTPDWAKEARKLTGGAGVDHVVEVGGADTFMQSLSAMKIGGRIGVVGVLTGISKDVSIVAIFGQNLKINGVTVGSREHFDDMCRALVQNKIHPVVDKRFELADASDAFRMMESASHFGKIVLEMK